MSTRVNPALREDLATLPELCGTQQIAAWCGVTPPAVANWLVRYRNWPRPVFRTHERYLWLPGQKDEWIEWHKGLNTGGGARW